MTGTSGRGRTTARARQAANARARFTVAERGPDRFQQAAGQVVAARLAGVATTHIPHRVPIGFRGNRIPDSELETQHKLQG